MTAQANGAEIKLVVTNSNKHKNIKEALKFCCKEIYEEQKQEQTKLQLQRQKVRENPKTYISNETHKHDTNAISEELLGELLYIGIIVKHVNNSRSKENVKAWLEQNTNYHIHMDILFAKDNGIEISTLAHKFHLQEEKYFENKLKTVYKWVLARRIFPKDFRTLLGDSEKKKITKWGNNMLYDYYGDGNQISNGTVYQVDEERILIEVANHKETCQDIDNVLLSLEQPYHIEGMIYMVELPLNIAQKYVNKKLVLKIYLYENFRVAKTRSGNYFLTEKNAKNLKKIFHYPSLLLDNVQWSSTFTSSMINERKKKRKKKKKKNGIYNWEETQNDDSDEDDDDDDDNYDEDGNNRYTGYNKNGDDENDDDEDDDGNYGEHSLSPHDGEFNDRNFPLNLNMYGICKSINKLDDYMYSRNYTKRNFKKIILTKPIIVKKPLNIKCKIVHPYLYLEIENVTQKNRINIYELFSKSVNIDNGDIFPLCLHPEDTYSFYLPIVNSVQIISKNNTKVKEKKRSFLYTGFYDMQVGNSHVMSKHHTVEESLTMASINQGINLTTNQAKNRGVKCTQDVSNRTSITKGFQDKEELLSFEFKNDKSIITLSIKWSIDNAANNSIWSQYFLEVEMPSSHMFKLEVSFVKEINCSSVLTVVFSFYNNHHEEIDILIEMQDESRSRINNEQSSLISFNSSIHVGIIKPFQRKSVSVRMLAIMLGVHNFPFVKITNKLSDTFYFVDLGPLLVTE
ncbi:hypothetical protein, conserved [Plasmodium gonderi]|uniref:Uncharacterized protein n=1 Tax=Plasmodium gonderi TaxID=77519 RepID=A0A1Y1JL86_PLAGO|nr:hypothetical protein, conserved [Plasmodium gonderi]GAW81977.1 hypothetical protein, conserved [Plasmodium gonderi]